METLLIHSFLNKRALVTRESARTVKAGLSKLVKPDQTEIALDFAGVDAVTPSFVDEILSVLKEALRENSTQLSRILILNSPTRLSAKYSAVARAHGAKIIEEGEGSWTLTAENGF